MVHDLALVHDSWKPIFHPLLERIESIFSKIADDAICPSRENVFAAFRYPVDSIKVVIIGQDPYPNASHATGLAFSVPADVRSLPASLRNIFRELHTDQGTLLPAQGDLRRWSENGVLLLNRVLTTREGESNSHLSYGWQEITDHICHVLGQRKVVAILWGKSAQELQRYFPHHIVGVHPSPLSAYKGFFGSAPFSKANAMLEQMGVAPVDWSLSR